MISSFSNAGYLMPRLRSAWHSNRWRWYLTPDHAFLNNRFFSTCSASASLRSCISRRRSLTSPEDALRAVSPEGRFLPASRNSFDQL